MFSAGHLTSPLQMISDSFSTPTQNKLPSMVVLI